MEGQNNPFEAECRRLQILLEEDHVDLGHLDKTGNFFKQMKIFKQKMEALKDHAETGQQERRALEKDLAVLKIRFDDLHHGWNALMEDQKVLDQLHLRWRTPRSMPSTAREASCL